MAEIIAAGITVCGSAVIAAGGCYMQIRKKKKRAYLKHRLFVLSKATPIIVSYDKVRTELFQYIQFNILINQVQDIMRSWIQDMNPVQYKQLTTGGALNNYIIGLEMTKIIKNIKLNQEVRIDKLPTIIKTTIYELLEPFYEELNNIISLINYEHDMTRDWLLLILDYVHLICVNTLNHWRVTSSQFNGSLNGIVWNNNIMGYAWFGKYKYFIQNYTNLWNFLVKNDVLPTQTSSVISDENTIVKSIPCNPELFKKLTEYDIKDVINQKCSIFQIQLSADDRLKNYDQVKKIKQSVNDKTYCHVKLLQATKTGKKLFYFDIYSIPITFVSDNKVETYFFGLQKYLDINAAVDDIQSILVRHTIASLMVSATMQQGAITLSRYVKNKSMIVYDIFNNNEKELRFITGHCLCNQIDFSIESFDYIFKAHQITKFTNMNMYNDLIAAASFQYSNENKLISAECWFIDDIVVIIHKK